MAYNLKEMTEMCSKWVAENGLMEHGGARLKDFLRSFRHRLSNILSLA